MNRILLVEDDLYIRDIYRRYLAAGGYEVDEAADGKEAIRKATEQDYALILLDIMLPGATGIDVLNKIRSKDSRSKETPVFLITNLAEESVINEALRIGANGYILKSQVPFGKVVEEVDKYLAHLKTPI